MCSPSCILKVKTWNGFGETNSVFEQGSSWLFHSQSGQIALTAMRATLLLYFFIFMLYDWIAPPHGTWALYFTNWTYFLLILHLALQVWHTVRVTRTGMANASSWKEDHSNLARFSAVVHESLLVSAVIVVTVYWLALCRPGDPCASDPVGINAHGINLLLVLIDFFIGRLVVVWFHVVYGLAWAIVYGLFAFCVQAIRGHAVYPIIDYNRAEAAGVWFPALFAGYVVIHSLFYLCVRFGLSKLRERVDRKYEIV